MSDSILVLDATLREGEQTPGVCFPPHVRAAIAAALDDIGVDILEAGHPAVTTEIRSSVKTIAGNGHRALVAAHARTLEADVELAIECGVGAVGLFFCVTDERLCLHDCSLQTAIDRIGRVIEIAKQREPELVVRFTPEDTVRSPLENVLAAAGAAVDAGADIISIADTTGYLVPGGRRSMYELVSRVREGLARKGHFPRIAVHCHNDRGLALANTLDGFRAGASVLDATVLGLGERGGLTDLATLLTVLASDFGLRDRWRLECLPALYRLVSRYSAVPIPVNQPVTGANAFTHCAGVHTQAALRDPMHYQSLDSALVGRRTRIALDHMSGASSLRHALAEIGADSDSELVEQSLAAVKRVGQAGRTVDLEELRLIVHHLTGRVHDVSRGGSACASASCTR